MIRDNDQSKAGGLQRPQLRSNALIEHQLLRPGGIVTWLDQSAVPIQEDGGIGHRSTPMKPLRHGEAAVSSCSTCMIYPFPVTRRCLSWRREADFSYFKGMSLGEIRR